MNSRTAVVLAGLTVILIVSAWWGVGYVRVARGYEVSGVPFFGFASARLPATLYSNQGGDGQRVQPQARGSAGASLLSVGGFWYGQDTANPLLFPDNVREKIPVGEPGTLADIAVAAREFGFKATVTRAYFGLWSLGWYANANRPIPVIVEQTLSEDYPHEQQNFFRVVIGVTPGGQEVIVHDYVLGEYQKMSRKEFLALWKKPYRLLVIEPREWSGEVKPLSGFSYEPAAYNPDQQKLLTTWYLGQRADYAKETDKAVGYYEKVIDNPARASFPPGHQLAQYTALMFLYLEKQDFSKIIGLEDDVNNLLPQVTVNFVGLNPALNKSIALNLLGEGFLGVGDKAEARHYAERVLSEDPDNFAAKQLLEKAK